jgi:hypothetical protein
MKGLVLLNWWIQHMPKGSDMKFKVLKTLKRTHLASTQLWIQQLSSAQQVKISINFLSLRK